MNVKTSILTALLTLTMSACSHIDESDRLIYVKPADVESPAPAPITTASALLIFSLICSIC